MFVLGGLGILFAAALWCHQPPPASARFDGLIAFHARRNGLDPRLVKAVIAVESEFYPRAVSKAGARGLMQVMPKTAEFLGFSRRDLHDPDANIRCGTAYLNLLFRLAARRREAPDEDSRELGLRRRVLAAYHGGPRFLVCRHWPAATRAYVRRVLFLYGSPHSVVDESAALALVAGLGGLSRGGK